MPRFRLRLLITLLLPSLLTAATPAAPASAPAPAPTKDNVDKSPWVFSLLPKSLQKNPRLELTVITEMTAAGKKLPPVSPASPAYFDTYAAGFKQLGDTFGNERTLKQEDLENLLVRSLASNGYLRAKLPAPPPSLMIIYTWGSHNRLQELDEENPSISGETLARNILDRAALVGGDKFARELLELFTQADAMSVAANATLPPDGQPPIPPEMLAFANPVNLFRMRSAKNEFLLDQTADDVYYVVASAYDYQLLAANKRLLLWRTRMTVAAQGVSQEQTLPTLILSAAPYFGKDMPEADTLSRRTMMREGIVEVGPTTVVESDVAIPPPAAPAAPPPPAPVEAPAAPPAQR